MARQFNIKDDNYNICGRIYCEDIRAVKKAVIFGHGFGGHKDNRAAERFAARILGKNKGAAVIVFDWPCHGDDVRKKIQLDDCLAYLRLVINEARERLHAEELFGYATSFGGYLFLDYIAKNGSPFKKMALRCPAVDMYEVLTTSLITPEMQEKLDKGKTAAAGFDRKVEVSREFLAELQETDLTKYDFIDYADDILILHGTKDEVVPMDKVKQFADDNLIDFIPVEKADHRFSDPAIMDAANAEIIHFFGMR